MRGIAQWEGYSLNFKARHFEQLNEKLQSRKEAEANSFFPMLREVSRTTFPLYTDADFL
jgi:hypothetical protein